MTAIQQLHDLRAECRNAVNKLPDRQLTDYENIVIGTLNNIERILYKIIRELYSSHPE